METDTPREGAATAPAAQPQPQLTPAEVSQRSQALLASIRADILEREEALELCYLALLADESVFLLGPPGVAKSQLARQLKYAVKDAKAFEYLMNRYSTPDEIFGPVSIKKLTDEDKYERNIENYLPGADIVFLDEIWKAGPSIQNTLLTILNEKLYRNGEREVQARMKLLVSASNELPAEGEGLEALYDRFLIRYVVNPISSNDNFVKLLTAKPTPAPTAAPPEAWTEPLLHQARALAQGVALPPHVLNTFVALREMVQDESAKEGPLNGLYISDRRWKKIACLVRAKAAMHGERIASFRDVLVASHCMWYSPHQRERCYDLLLEAIRLACVRLTNTSLKSRVDKLRNEIKTSLVKTKVEHRRVAKLTGPNNERALLVSTGNRNTKYEAKLTELQTMELMPSVESALGADNPFDTIFNLAQIALAPKQQRLQELFKRFSKPITLFQNKTFGVKAQMAIVQSEPLQFLMQNAQGQFEILEMETEEKDVVVEHTRPATPEETQRWRTEYSRILDAAQTAKGGLMYEADLLKRERPHAAVAQLLDYIETGKQVLDKEMVQIKELKTLVPGL